MVRDLFLGRTRFKEFLESPEGIPTNILTERLDRLVEGGIARRVPVSEGGKRMAYELTEKGRALREVVVALKDWGLAWEPDTDAKLSGK